MQEILLIDDDRELRPLLERYMASQGFYLHVLHDGSALDQVMRERQIDLLVLDVMLPGLNGFEILRKLRKSSDLPVIMLTAHGSDTDRIEGLECGADDYLPKPFNPRELIARMQAVLRRHKASSAQLEKPIQIGDLVLNPSARSVHIAGGVVVLTGAEFDLLLMLVRNAGSVTSRDELSRWALGHPEQPWDRSLDTHISNLRRKIGPDANGQRRISNVRGAGYAYSADGGL